MSRRCDEWYHTQCVNLPDLEIDLVDQFICPPCIDSTFCMYVYPQFSHRPGHPHLSLCTTYKTRCLFGLRHPDPTSIEACHKPARGAYSKMCSDACGVKYMRLRMAAWGEGGGEKGKLWESVWDAERSEGMVVCAEEEEAGASAVAVLLKKTSKEREVERLTAQLDGVVMQREELKKKMEVVLWRERLTALASERAERVDTCGWDQRMCYGEEEYVEFGAGALESYEGTGAEDEAVQVDALVDGEWWCTGKKKCERHAG
jgi:COMPASS component SPP1